MQDEQNLERDVESPRKRKKCQPTCSPVQCVLQTSVVEHSPVVAVSVSDR